MINLLVSQLTLINIGTRENKRTYYGGFIDVCPFFIVPRNFHYAV